MTIRKILTVLIFTITVLAAGQARSQDELAQGREAYRAQDHAKAVALLGQYVKKHPRKPEAWRLRALSLAALSRHEEALRDLDRGLNFNAQDLSLLLAKGKILGEMERRPAAIATLTQVLALAPDNPEALKERAENLIQEGQVDQAILDLNRAVALNPNDPWAYHKLGMAELCRNRYREAVAALSTAIRLSPETPLFYFSRGEIYLRHLDSRDQAVEDFHKGCALGHPLCCRELEMLGVKPQ